MDDAGGVGRIERVGQLRHDAGDLGHRQRPAGEASSQGFALVVRHRDERLAGMRTDLVDRGDVRVIQRAGGARLSQQAGRSVRVADVFGGKEFERDAAVQASILSQINRPHSPGADLADDPVMGDLGSHHVQRLLRPPRPASAVSQEMSMMTPSPLAAPFMMNARTSAKLVNNHSSGE